MKKFLTELSHSGRLSAYPTSTPPPRTGAFSASQRKELPAEKEAVVIDEKRRGKVAVAVASARNARAGSWPVADLEFVGKFHQTT